MFFLSSLSFNFFLISFLACLFPFLIYTSHQFALCVTLLLYFLINPISNLKRCLYGLFFLIFIGYTFNVKFHYDSLSQTGDFNDVVTIIEPQFSVNDTTILVKSSNHLKYQLKIKRSPTQPLFNYGDRYYVSGTIKPISSPTNPGQFNFPRWLYLNGVSGQIFPKKFNLMNKSSIWSLKRLQFTIKSNILAYHKQMLPSPLSDLFTGLIFGEHGTKLPVSLKMIFKKTGLTHLLVVSGSQVALIVGIFFIGLSYFNCHRHITLFVIIIVSIIFYGITGGGASVFRASLMTVIVAAFKLYHYRVSIPFVIANVATIMMIFNPLIIFDFGAYLSFLATLSLIYGVPMLAKQLPQHWPLLIRTMIGMSIAPFIATFPFLWLFFYKISLISILSNLIMLPIIELIVILGFFTTIIGMILPIITIPLMSGIAVILTLMIKALSYLASFSWSEFSLGKPSLVLIALIYFNIGLLISSISLQNKKRFLFLNSIFIFFIICFTELREKPLVITVLDVGQGDATLIECPNGKTVLIDAGKGRYPDVGRNVIIPYLAYRGINTIDLLVITHYDYDHYGGVASLAEAIKINKIIDNGNASYHNQIQSWFQENITIQAINTGDTISIDPKISISCLTSSSINRYHDKNNRSISLLIQYEKSDVLLTGDLESIGEQFIIQNYDPIDIDILMLGHHGSKTSTIELFLQWATPEVGLISAGRNNRYGHPHPSVLSRCNQYDMDLYRTDYHGAITLTTYGDSFLIKTYLNRFQWLSLGS